MFSTVFRARTVHIRSFHSPVASSRGRISQLLNVLSKETHSPLWNLVHETHSTRLPMIRIVDLVQKHGTSVEEFTKWKSATSRVDLESASQDGGVLPPWVVFYLVIYKVRSPAHANGPMMNFIFTQLDALPLELRGPLLIFSALHLSKFNLLQPLARVIDTFLTTELPHDALQFNLLLQALSANSVRSTESANLVVRILKAMEGRQLTLRSETYHALLHDRFVTVELTKYLRSRMIHEGFVPDLAHLEAYLRVFAKGGAIHETQKYAETIRRHERGANGSRSSTVALSGFKDRASAFEFLKELTGNSADEDKPTTPPRSPYLLPLYKKKLDAHDYTASLTVASRDPQVRVGQFLRMFRRMGHYRGSMVRPTIVSYTVAIRGLLYRNAIPVAERIWRELVKTRYVLDRPALSVGLETLTRARKPHEAFVVLEKHAHRADIHALNVFMGALNKINRPDVVFKLWDYMETLYGVYPTAETLSVLLQAARLACQLDNTFQGTVAHLALHNPFRKPSPRPGTREEMVQAIESVLGNRKGYQSGIWNNQPPLEGARAEFRKVVFGNAYDRVVGVTPPAYAPSTAELSIVLSTPRHDDIPPDILAPNGTSWYPHIIPTNDNFLQYLLLLGLNQRASEIPLTLAWMRASGVKPDRATLAVAMIFWGEIGMDPPLVEAIGRRKGRESGFEKLLEWMKEWVGEEKMPRAENLRKWQRWIKTERESNGCVSDPGRQEAGTL